MKNQNRFAQLDYIKGVAIIFVVIIHVLRFSIWMAQFTLKSVIKY